MTTTPSLTANQQRVYLALRHASSPMTAYALLDQLRGKGMTAPIQVYRALDKLRQQGLVHRLETLNAYVACTHGHEHGPTVFAICDACGHTDELVDRTINRSLERLARTRDFVPDSSTIEIHGKCSTCTALG